MEGFGSRLYEPCQTLVSLRRGTASFLLASAASRLISTRLETGEVVSQWQASRSQHAINGQQGEQGGRPAKKQKTSISTAEPLDVINLVVAPNQHYVVAVTEDKCIHVLGISIEGNLNELSQRTMPKRPCAVQILPDNETLLVGDKFGDVYSLPLLPPSDQHVEVAPVSESTFKPAASTTTVHSARNLKALEMQRQQMNFTPRKDGLNFAHKLLLGHVSMLTDMISTQRQVDGRGRSYIITSDRDEHIRISRGPPQAHIIEGYCLGHTEFVSKLCLIPGTDLLVSGGGDDWLGVWDWRSFKLLRKLVIKESIVRARSAPGSPQQPANVQIAVSGIWVLPLRHGRTLVTALAVACEGVSGLFVIPVEKLLDGGAAFSYCPTKSAQPIAVSVIIPEKGTCVVSLCSRTLAGSSRLVEFSLMLSDTGEVELEECSVGATGALRSLTKVVDDIHDGTGDDGITQKPREDVIEQLLNRVGKLKKRTGWAGEPAENDDA